MNSLFYPYAPSFPPQPFSLAHVLQGGELVREQEGWKNIARFPHPQVIADRDFCYCTISLSGNLTSFFFEHEPRVEQEEDRIDFWPPLTPPRFDMASGPKTSRGEAPLFDNHAHNRATGPGGVRIAWVGGLGDQMMPAQGGQRTERNPTGVERRDRDISTWLALAIFQITLPGHPIHYREKAEVDRFMDRYCGVPAQVIFRAC